jgi:hypothetical protein
VAGRDSGTAKEASPEAATRGLVAVALGWLLPGLGHAWLGRPRRGAAMGGILLLMFATGLLLEGSLSKPSGGTYLSALATVADLGIGPLYFVAQLLDWGAGTVTAATHEIGNTFHWSAGVMNLLLLLDAHDIGTGRK